MRVIIGVATAQRVTIIGIDPLVRKGDSTPYIAKITLSNHLC